MAAHGSQAQARCKKAYLQKAALFLLTLCALSCHAQDLDSKPSITQQTNFDGTTSYVLTYDDSISKAALETNARTCIAVASSTV